MNTFETTDPYTGEWTAYEETTKTYNGLDITDAMCDDIMYKKVVSTTGFKYFKRVLADGRINVKWFGATGDGLTDDAPYFQSAVDFLSHIGGGILFLPHTNYLVSHVDFIGTQYSNIKIVGDNVTITGNLPESRHKINSFSTYSRYSAADGIFAFSAFLFAEVVVAPMYDDSESIKNIEISGISFVTDVVNKGFDELSHHIAAYGVSNFSIQDCSFTGFLGDGIAICRGLQETENNNKAYNSNVRIVNSKFDGINKNNRQGISFYYCDGFEVDNCSFANITREDMPGAIDIESDAPESTIARNGIITNCQFKNIGGFAAICIVGQNEALESSGIMNYRNFRIDNCRFEDIKTPLFVVSPNTNEYLNYNGIYNIVFENSNVIRTQTILLLVRAFGVKVSNVVYKNILTTAAVIDNAVGASQIRFENCEFNTVSFASGLVFSGLGKNIDFISCKFLNFANWILTFNYGESIGRIENNQFFNSTAPDVCLVVGNGGSPESLKHSNIKNNQFLGNIPPIDLYLMLNGLVVFSYNAANVEPDKIFFGKSAFVSYGLLPAPVSADAIGLVKNERLDDYSGSPVIYQTFFPFSRIDITWKRQSLNSTTWLEWKQVEN